MFDVPCVCMSLCFWEIVFLSFRITATAKQNRGKFGSDSLAPGIGFRNRNISPERQDERTKIRHCWRIDRSACRKSKTFLLHFIVWLLFAYFCCSSSSTIHPSGLFNTFSLSHWFYGASICCVPCARFVHRLFPLFPHFLTFFRFFMIFVVFG